VKLIISFVSPEILRARQFLSEYIQNREKHIRGYLFIDSLEFFEINLGFALEAYIKDFKHFLKGLDALIKIRRTTAFLSKLAFTKNWYRLCNWHVT